MYTPLSLIVVPLLFCAITTQAQHPTSPAFSNKPDPEYVTFGAGFGQDYGGLGGNLTVYPQQNIGLFASVGWAFAGIGYNAGVKLRLLPNHGAGFIRPFVVGMYGYTAAIAVTNDVGANKLFYGPTIGGGFDIGNFRHRGGCLSLAILVPIRNQDAQNYIDELRAEGVSFGHNLSSVSFSAGYKFILPNGR